MRNEPLSLEDAHDQARAWVDRLAREDVGPADHAAFDAWLDQSPLHGEAYQHELEAEAAIAALSARFAAHPRYTRVGLWARRAGFAGGALAAAALALIVATPLANAPDWSAPVATQVAEVRTVTLEDGSVVTLGARTRYETAFSESERRLRLSEGEAFFRVAGDTDRPFLIETQGAIVRVVGTEFEVKSTPERVRVVVAAGVVEVTEPQRFSRLLNGARTVRLLAGEEISISATAAPEILAPAPASRHEPAAWRDGLLVYEDASLAEVVADANRYSRQPIIIAEGELASLRVTAVYPADQVDRLLASLDAALPLDVEQRADGQVRLVAPR